MIYWELSTDITQNQVFSLNLLRYPSIENKNENLLSNPDLTLRPKTWKITIQKHSISNPSRTKKHGGFNTLCGMK